MRVTNPDEENYGYAPGKKYYVVLEPLFESDQLDPSEMANWIYGAMMREAAGHIEVTVYEEPDDLVADEREED